MEMFLGILEGKGEIRARDIDLGVTWSTVPESYPHSSVPRKELSSPIFHPLPQPSTEKSCGRILLGFDDTPNPVVKRVGCHDWQPQLGPFTWMDDFPKDIRVLCKAANVPNTPLSIIHYLPVRTHSHDHILKIYNSGTRPHQKFHSPITAFSHLTSVSISPSLILTLNLIFKFIKDSSLQSLPISPVYHPPPSFTSFPIQSGPHRSSFLV